jgi:hypothetical protein
MPGEGANSSRQSPALISPLPARYLTHGGRNGHSFVFIKVFGSCRDRSAEAGEVLPGQAHPAGFWRLEFVPSLGNERGFRSPQFNIFTASDPRGESFSAEEERRQPSCNPGIQPLPVFAPFQHAPVMAGQDDVSQVLRAAQRFDVGLQVYMKAAGPVGNPVLFRGVPCLR